MGPFDPIERPAESDADLTRIAGRSGRAQARSSIRAAGFSTRGNPISGAKVELWQANAAGRYAHPADPATAPLDPDFQGFAAVTSDARRRMADRHRQARRL